MFSLDSVQAAKITSHFQFSKQSEQAMPLESFIEDAGRSSMASE